MSVRSPAITLVTLLLMACNGEKSGGDTLLYPVLEVSTTRLEFDELSYGESKTRTLTISNDGDLPMGIASVTLNEDEMEENFSISYSAADVECPGGSSDVTARRTPDTGAPEDTGEETDTGDTGSSSTTGEGGLVVLDAGCRLPVRITLNPVTLGEILSSLVVTTVAEDVGSGLPAYYDDPDNEWKTVILEGSATKTAANLIASPLNINFGAVYEGQTETEYIRIRNVGEDDLTLGAPTLSDTCDGGYSITDTYEDGRVLEGDASTLIEVSFSPVQEDDADCTLYFTSDDPDEPVVDVRLQANTGSDPNNTPPTAQIRTPAPGFVINGNEPFELEFNIFDLEQSADTLTCRVKGTLVLGETIADCTPSDESGHVVITIDPEASGFEPGVEAIVVDVKDGSGEEARAATSVLYKVGYPDSDDDGDGFGDDETEENIDCDDTDANVFPDAGEIFDSKDNDCDGVVDEGTEGHDDDEDGYSEVEGDCNDFDDNTYEGADESGDYADNDCDGVVDEGTQLYDDDGDGFSEAENDCDDDDVAVSPVAEEYCDGDDNDCNGLKDQQDGCIELSGEPIIVGDIQMAVTTLGVGETTTLTAYGYDPDGGKLTYAWQQDTDLTALGYNALDSSTSSSVTFTAPSKLPEGSEGEIYTMYVVVIDEDGDQDYALGSITVLPRAVSLEQVSYSSDSGCGGSSDASLFLIPALGGLSLIRRRRKTQV